MSASNGFSAQDKRAIGLIIPSATALGVVKSLLRECRDLKLCVVCGAAGAT